jgi:hypothetical protein
VDQAANEQVRILCNDRPLPRLQTDRPQVLPPRPVLREQARPMLPIHGHLNAARSAVKTRPRSLAWADHLHSRGALRDYPRVGGIKCEPQAIGARMARDTAIAEIDA